MAVFDKNIRIVMLKGEKGEIGDAGDYSTLQNKPKINNVTLNGTQSAADLGLVAVSEIDSINQDIGELQTLDTTDKSSLVNAVNEVNNNISKQIVLYDDVYGTIGNIDFSSNLSSINHNLDDFNYLEFYYKHNDISGMCMEKVYKFGDLDYFNNIINLSVSGIKTEDSVITFITASTQYYVGVSTYPDNAIRDTEREVEMKITNTNGTLSDWTMTVATSNIKVYRVVGYLE